MDTDFSGRTALVTGDASGIGLAVANALRAAGATVIGIDRSRSDDVADPETWLKRADSLAAVDLAVVNAGISDAAAIVDIDFMAWRRLLAVNLDGAMLSLQAAMRAIMAHGRGGAIVTTASISGIKAEPGTGAYGASKAALIQLTKVTGMSTTSNS